MLGEVIGNHRVTAKLGDGDTGVVYRAEHTVIGRHVAIKFLHPELSRDRELVGRFFEELRVVSALHHPGIVEFFDFGYFRDAAYLVMEYLEYETLAARIRRKKRIRAPRALAVIKQVAGALADAHRAGVVHGELESENIILVPDSAVPGGKRIKVLDFGIARLRQHAGPRGHLPRYPAPELCDPGHGRAGRVAADPRVDLFALGCILYEMLAGRPPFVASSRDALAEMVRNETPPSLYQFATDITPELDALVRALLAKHIDDRMSSAPAVLDAISASDAAAQENSQNAPFPDEPVSVSFVSEPPAPPSRPAPGQRSRAKTAPAQKNSAKKTPAKKTPTDRAPVWAVPVAIVVFVAITALTLLILR